MTDAPLPMPPTAGTDALALPLPNAVPQTDDQPQQAQSVSDVQPGATAMANPDQTPAPVSGSASIGARPGAAQQLASVQPVQPAPKPAPTNAAQHLAGIAMDLIKNAPRYAANAAQAAGRVADKAPVVGQFRSGSKLTRQKFDQEREEKAQNIALIHAQTINTERLNSINTFNDQQEFAKVGKEMDDEMAQNHPLVSGGMRITKNELLKNLASAVGNPNSPWNPDKITVNQVAAEKNPDGTIENYYNVRQRSDAQRTPTPEMANLWKSVDLRDANGKPIDPTGPMSADSIDAMNKTALTLMAYNANIKQAEVDTNLKQIETENKLQGSKDKITIANYLGSHPGLLADDKDTFSLLHEIANLKDPRNADAASAAARQLAQYDPKDMEKHFEDLETRRHNKSEEAINDYKAKHPLGETFDNNVPLASAMQDKVNQLQQVNPTGYAVLKKYPANIQASLMKIGFGDGSASLDEAFPQTLRKGVPGINRSDALGVLAQINPNWNEHEYRQLQDAYKTVTTGDNAIAKQNFNNFIQHSEDAVDTLADAGRKGPRVWNTVLNEMTRAGYGTDAQKISAAMVGPRGEISLLLSAGYKPDGDMQKTINTILNDGSTPGELSAALQKFAELGIIRLDNINEGYKSASNGRNFPNLVSQATLSAAQHLGVAKPFMDRLQKLDVGGTMFGDQSITGSNRTVNAIGANGQVVQVPAGQPTRLGKNGQSIILAPDGKSWLLVVPTGK